MKMTFVAVSILALGTLSACNSENSASANNTAATQSVQAEAAAQVKPSFDCAKAESEAEKMVCSDNALAQLDNEVARLFALAEKDSYLDAAAKAELTTIQRGWVKGRDDCWKADDKMQCVLTSYGMRAHELRQGYVNARSANPKSMSTGPVAFVCDGLEDPLGMTFFVIEPGYAYLRNGDTSVMFTAVADAPDARYTAKGFDGRDYTLVTEGDNVTYTRPGEAAVQCKRDEIG